MLDEGFQEFCLEFVFWDHFFGMPLDADEEAVWVGGLGGFDDAIGAFGRDSEPFADSSDGLMVEGVYFEFRLTVDLTES